MKYSTESTTTGTRFIFADGTTLETRASDNGGTLETPPRDGMGCVSFPVRHAGDVLHALRMHDGATISASVIPASCRAW